MQLCESCTPISSIKLCFSYPSNIIITSTVSVLYITPQLTETGNINLVYGKLQNHTCLLIKSLKYISKLEINLRDFIGGHLFWYSPGLHQCSAQEFDTCTPLVPAVSPASSQKPQIFGSINYMAYWLWFVTQVNQAPEPSLKMTQVEVFGPSLDSSVSSLKMTKVKFFIHYLD